MSRVLVVEDEAAIAELIALNLRHAGFEVQVASDAEAAVAEVDRVLPDLVLLDWMLPGASGLSLAKRWRGQQRTKDLPVIMLTARAEEADKVAGLDAGADDYLTKPFAMEELLARVEVLGRRSPAAEADAILRVGDLVMDPVKRRVSLAGERIELSPREFEVLEVFMREPGRTFSRDEICERIWEREHEYDTRTVEIFIMRLRRKLDRAAEESRIRTVRSVGYVMDPVP